MSIKLSTKIAEFCDHVLRGTTQFAYNKQRDNFKKYSKDSGFSQKTLDHIYNNILQLRETDNANYKSE